jgi:hypothetical protein
MSDDSQEPPVSAEQIRALTERVSRLEAALHKPVPEMLTQFLDRIYKFHGPLKSSADLTRSEKVDANLFFQYRDKSEVALSVASLWKGGDYFEFGSSDLNTFLSMLTAYDLYRLDEPFPDVRFYGFDLFGSADPRGDAARQTLAGEGPYFAPYLASGDRYAQHLRMLDDHRLFRDRSFLVQGFFEDTLTPAFKAEYQREGRSIGFAFLDCNQLASYQVVFEFLFDLMAPDSFFYMDEYFAEQHTFVQFEQFREELRAKRNIGTAFIRNAGGFGGLFRLYDLSTLPPRLTLSPR